MVYSFCVEVGFHCTFQNLRDLVSVSGTYEPAVISSHILQSAFLAEEREHPREDDWKKRNLSIRAKNVLKRLQDKNVPHAILKGRKAYTSPSQVARTSLEAGRLIHHTDSLRNRMFRMYRLYAICCLIICFAFIYFETDDTCIYFLF